MGSLVEFDVSEATELTQKMMHMVVKYYPKEAKNFMNRQGTKLKRLTKDTYREYTEKRTGTLLKGVKKRPAHKYKGEWQVRIVNTATDEKNKNYSGAIERGHPVFSHGKETDFYADGRYPATHAKNRFRRQFFSEVDDFVDQLIEKGLDL